eukprot:c19754_g1_i3 orf=189-485(+)
MLSQECTDDTLTVTFKMLNVYIVKLYGRSSFTASLLSKNRNSRASCNQNQKHSQVPPAINQKVSNPYCHLRLLSSLIKGFNLVRAQGLPPLSIPHNVY